MSATVVIREPLGLRTAQLPLTLGGSGADVQVPGSVAQTWRLEASGGQWNLQGVGAGAAPLQLNGSLQPVPLSLADGDVVRIGDALLTLHPDSARIDVDHLVGNATIAPVQQHVLPGEEVVAGVREIVAAGSDAAAANAIPLLAARRGAAARWLLLPVLLLVAVAGVLFTLVPVGLQLTPAATSVKVQGLLNWRAGDRIFLLPGRRTLDFSAPGYHSQRVTLDVARALADAAPLPIRLALLPGVLVVDTQGEAAELLVDGGAVAMLPGEVQLEHGAHEIIVRAPRRIDFVARVDIEGGGRRQTLDVRLQPASGWLQLDTLPAAARITVDGEFRGTAPLKLELDSGLRQLSIAAKGRRDWNSQIAIIAGQTLDLGRIDLAVPAPVVLQAAAAPSDASPVAAAAAASNAVVAEAPKPPPAARVQSPLLGALRLLPAGRYLQGSDRREQGRRANEVQRQVTLSRAFYLAETEVSNAQFHAFRASHAAGIALEKSLDLDNQAVSNLSWNDAVEFCNWLSLREGLPAAYERRDGRWQLLQPVNQGYRLPTEAEWEYAARYVDGQRWQRYAWGEVLPPPPAAANLAGQESLPTRPGPEVRLAAALPQYRDEHAVIAPVGSYARSPAGFFDLGGNVSEWMHDVYASLPEAAPVTDPMGAATDGPHSIRGPSWRTAAIAELRLAWRERATEPAQTIGFRVARYAEATP